MLGYIKDGKYLDYLTNCQPAHCRLHSLELDAGTKLLNLECHYQTDLFMSFVVQSFIVCHCRYLLVHVTTLCQVQT